MKQRSAVLTYVSRETLSRYGTILASPGDMAGSAFTPFWGCGAGRDRRISPSRQRVGGDCCGTGSENRRERPPAGPGCPHRQLWLTPPRHDRSARRTRRPEAPAHPPERAPLHGSVRRGSRHSQICHPGLVPGSRTAPRHDPRAILPRSAYYGGAGPRNKSGVTIGFRGAVCGRCRNADGPGSSDPPETRCTQGLTAQPMKVKPDMQWTCSGHPRPSAAASAPGSHPDTAAESC